jgi:hypothetical protein
VLTRDDVAVRGAVAPEIGRLILRPDAVELVDASGGHGLDGRHETAPMGADDGGGLHGGPFSSLEPIGTPVGVVAEHDVAV